MLATAPTSEIPTLVLERDDQAPRLARIFLAERFREWGVLDDYTGRLVVCELATNAYRHGAGTIIVRVFRDECGAAAVIEVWDEGEGLPVVRADSATAEDGRGLSLMSELVLTWGVRPISEGGKIVWAKCAL